MKTITNFLITSILLFSFSAFAHNPNPPQDPQQPKPSDLIMGEWVSEYPILDHGVELITYFNFTEHTMNLTATCQFHYPEVELTVSIEPRVRYHNNDLYILETQNGSISDGYRYCNAKLQPATWQFYFDGTGKMVLFAAIPYAVQFHLVRPE